MRAADIDLTSRPVRMFLAFCAVWAVLCLYVYPFLLIDREGWMLNEFPHWMWHRAVDDPAYQFSDGRDSIMEARKEWIERSDFSQWLAVMS